MKRIFAIFYSITLVWAAYSAEPQVSILPNPSQGQVTLTFVTNENTWVKMEVFSVLGSKLMEQTYAASETRKGVSLDLTELADGVYLIRVTQGNMAQVKRIKIQR